jgi:RNA polymerase sigma-70 factor (ECF subfamily)
MPRPRQTRPEQEALERSWLAGDDEALARLHARYRARLEGVAFRILRNRADAEDVVQRIFVSMRGAAYEGRSSPWTYLYRAAVNGAMNVLRSRRRRDAAERHLLEHQLVHPPSAPPSAEAKILEGEILAEVAKALLQLKPQHRRVLTLRITHGLTNTEIAERENLPLPTVGTWLRRGREDLRRALGPLLREMSAGHLEPGDEP